MQVRPRVECPHDIEAAGPVHRWIINDLGLCYTGDCSRGAEMSKTFSQYLSDWPMTDSPKSDFVRDAGNDRRLAESTSWPELEAYLFSRAADRPQIKAAKVVWRGYTNQRRRTP